MRIKQYLLFSILAVFIAWSQFILLKPHLQYGFSDVDWGFLFYYKEHKEKFPNIIENFYQTFLRWGVYTHQQYYIGVQEEFFGLDFQKFQITIHIFKTLAAISAYPLFLIITQSYIAAFIGVILFAFSYSSVGTMYTVVTSSDYSAIFAMNIFFYLYWWIIEKRNSKWYLSFVSLLLFIFTLFLSTERMYPILFWLIAGEIFLLIYNKFSRKYLLNSYKRLAIIFIPVLTIIILYPAIVNNFLTTTSSSLFKKIIEGNMQLLLNPFIALGSIIIPHGFWKYFGTFTLNGQIFYVSYFTSKQFIVLILITLLLGQFISKKFIKFTIITMLQFIIGASLIFYLASHHKSHFDPTFISPALIGIYILAIGFSSFFFWVLNDKKNRLLIGIFGGITMTILYIVLTWVSTDYSLIFTGAHRYLTVPALLISLSVGCLIRLMTIKLQRVRGFAKVSLIIPVIVLVSIILIWSKQISFLFEDQLNKGFGASDKQNMRNQLLSYIDNLDSNQKSLFFFDFSEDPQNGPYYDNTLLGGFSTWMLWHSSINFNERLRPDIFWNNKDRLKSSKTIIDNEVGFYVYENFFPISNFYAFRLKDKKVINIKDELLEELGI